MGGGALLRQAGWGPTCFATGGATLRRVEGMRPTDGAPWSLEGRGHPVPSRAGGTLVARGHGALGSVIEVGAARVESPSLAPCTQRLHTQDVGADLMTQYLAGSAPAPTPCTASHRRLLVRISAGPHSLYRQPQAPPGEDQRRPPLLVPPATGASW
eukprot:358216-Chlamydomonas_euryale.AAC.3